MDAFLFVAVSTLFTIVNPLGAVGPFLAMTVNESSERRRNMARRASITAAGILAGSALVGAFIFRMYGITLPALRIAGGILLFFIAFDMVNARPSRTKQTEEEEQEGVEKEDIAVFPLGIPLLAGPGSIVSVFMLADQAETLTRQAALYGAISITGLTMYLTLREAPRLIGILGQTGINVFSRLMGVVLAAIAVQFVLDGIRAALPALAAVGS
ncbi:MAG TPA: MarC family protein [Bdellovibrionales bacterium]|nr:MarC family protein [Bdellovibrionales bacterium]